MTSEDPGAEAGPNRARRAGTGRLLRTGLTAGASAPDFDLPALAGGRVRLSDYRGRRLLLVLVDSGCAPCNALGPELQQLHERSGDPAIVVVSHLSSADEPTPTGYEGVTFPVALQRDWQVNVSYGIFATPCAFLIGKNGRVESSAIVGRSSIIAAGNAQAASPVPALLRSLASRRQVLTSAVRGLAVAAVAAVATRPYVAYAAGDYALPAGSASDWRVRTDLGNQPCNPLNPVETNFSMVNTPAGPGAQLAAAASDCMCCACIGRSKTFHLPSFISTDTATLKGYFKSSRGAGDPYSVGSFRVMLLVGTSEAGFKVFAAENRPNNNCTYPAGSEVVLGSGASFEIPLKTIVPGAKIDTIEVALMGYGCCPATNMVEVGGLRLNSPELAGTTVPTPATTHTPVPAQTSLVPPILGWVAGGVVVAGGILWWYLRRPRPKPGVPVAPGGAPVAPRSIEKPTPCDCGCGVTITGPNDLGICACQKVTYSLTQTGSPVAILRANLPDGRELFARSYHADLKTSCQGNGVPGDPTFSWSLGIGEKMLTLDVTATLPYNCPGEGAASATCICENFRIALHEAPCVISIITIEVGLVEIGHAAMQVTCGEFSTIYGFFAQNREDLAGDIFGQMGQVQTVSSSGAQDAIGQDYSGYYPTYDKRIWNFEVSCDKCDCLRKYWEKLAANPGIYELLGWNCASRVYDALVHCGLEIKGPLADKWFRPGQAENQLALAPAAQVDDQGRPFTIGDRIVVPAVQK